MKNEIMNGVQGLQGTAAANTKNGREKAQEQKSPFATFALFRGYSVNVNPTDQLSSRQSNSVKSMLWVNLTGKSYANTSKLTSYILNSGRPSQAQSKRIKPTRCSNGWPLTM
jgi:hypothetical protein